MVFNKWTMTVTVYLVKTPKEKKLMNIYTVYHSNPKLNLLSNC